jgi:hypothetical protein
MPLYLILRKKGNSSIVLTLSVWFRVLFLAIIGVFLIGMGASGTSVQEIGIFPSLFLLVCCLSLLYEETWIFDRKEGTVTRRFGLLILNTKKTFRKSEIERFCLSSFVRGAQANLGEKKSFFQREMLRLSFITGEEMTDIEIQSSRRKKRMEENGRVIAEFCSRPFDIQ